MMPGMDEGMNAMTNTPDDKTSSRQPQPATPIATVSDFGRGMLNAARELYQNEALRLEVAKHIS